MVDAMGALIWAAISEENAHVRRGSPAIHLFNKASAELWQICHMPLQTINRGTSRHKKERQSTRPWRKKNIWGAGGNEVLAINVLCCGVCG
jgi:hypothetical protein